MTNLIGQTLDRYQILSLLGQGGMGAVYRAHDTKLKRDIALKLMHPHLVAQPQFKARFLQEAQTAAGLDHPGIVKVFDFNENGDLLYIVMEFIAGGNLADLLHTLRAQSQWLTLPQALQMIHQIALALDYAHQQGIFHRDVKPANIMLRASHPANGVYQPVITDLGLAKLSEGGVMTQTGASMGTPAYISPEQALGEATDARSDVYSLGVLLYELALGQRPFPASTFSDAIRYHVRTPPPSPVLIRPDVPARLAQLILQTLEKAPEKRFQSAGALAQAISALPPQTPSASATEPTEMFSFKPTVTVVALVERLEVGAGGSAVLPLRLLNQTDTAMRCTIGAEGEAAPWAQMPAPLILQPGEQKEVRLLVRPPRAATLPSGEYALIARVASQNRQGPVRSRPVTICVLPYYGYQTAIHPEEVQAGKPFQVAITNQGNAPQSFQMTWLGPAHEVTVDPSQARIEVQPGLTTTLDVIARARRRWVGGSKTYPITIQVQPRAGRQAETTMTRTVVSRAVLPPWAPPLLALLLLGAGMVTYRINAASPPTVLQASEAAAVPQTAPPLPTNAPVPTLAPTNTLPPTLAPTDTPAPTAAPTNTAVPTAPPVATATPAPTAPPRPTDTLSPPTAAPTAAPTVPPTAPAPPSANFAGVWHTNFADLQLTQSGNQVTGHYHWYGDTQEWDIAGTVTDQTVQGHYMNDATTEFVFNLATNGNYFEGYWLHRASGEHKQWCGVKSGPLPAGCGFSGAWQARSDYCFQWQPTMEITQEGRKVSGKFDNGTRNGIGTVNGTIGGFGPNTQYSVRGTFRMNADGYQSKFRWDLVELQNHQFTGWWQNSKGQHVWCGWRSGETEPACGSPPTCP